VSKSVDDSKSASRDLIFDFNDPFMRRWDALILILAIWSSIIVPFKVAFNPPVDFQIEIFESVMYWFFIVDIMVQFRTSYITFEGQLITDWK
jgi:hypothetical protein